MKNSTLTSIAIFALPLLLVYSCETPNNTALEEVPEIAVADDGLDTTQQVSSSTTLTEEEVHDLLHLAEEEKLARDVYIYAFEKYDLKTFNNISKSEQFHLDEVLAILLSNEEEDPTHPDEGVFFNETLQELYHQLTAQVDLSLLEALKVGATIEDLDIMDIDVFTSHTTKEELIVMYDNLKCGSRNHMRSFYSQILAQDGTYTPQFISLALFNDIIGSDGEKCSAE